MNLRFRFLIIFIVLVTSTVFYAAARPLDFIDVTTIADVTANDGLCSLREAVQSANTDSPSGSMAGECSAGSGADTISLPTGTYLLEGNGFEDNNQYGDLDIDTPITIHATGSVTLTTCAYCPVPSGMDRVFHIHSEGTLDLSNVTLADSGPPGGIEYPNEPTVPPGEWGGAILAMGEFLTLTNVIFDNNHAGTGNHSNGAPQGGPPTNGGNGGAVAVTDGVLFISQSTFMRNHAGNGGQESNSMAAGGDGGALYVESGVSARIFHTLIRDNHAGNSPIAERGSGEPGGNGGGIASNGYVRVNNSAIVNNQSGQGYRTGNGGGIFVDGAALELLSSTVSGNLTGDSTIYFNGSGGGIFVDAGEILDITHSTIVANTVPTTGLEGEGGGMTIVKSAYVSIRNSILADNQSNNPTSGIECSGSLSFVTYLLLENAAGCNVSGGTGNIIGQDPQLLPLADNGGDTPTHALSPESPAIDAGNCLMATTDQRGFLRPWDVPTRPNVADGCDMGAFEADSLPPTPTPTNTPTFTNTPTATNTPTVTNTPTNTPTTTPVPPTATATPTVSPTVIPTHTYTPTPTEEERLYLPLIQQDE